MPITREKMPCLRDENEFWRFSNVKYPQKENGGFTSLIKKKKIDPGVG